MNWAMAAGGMNVLGGISGFAGNSKSAKSASAVAEYNAQITERNAKVFEQEAEQKILMGDVANVRNVQEFGRLMDSAQVAYNNSGVVSTSDTPLLVLLENARQADQDLAFTDYNTQVSAGQSREKATGLRLQSNITRMEGAAKARAYQMKGYQSLISGAQGAAGAMRFA